MCLTTKDPTIKVAKKNIIVYKGGYYKKNRFESGFWFHSYNKMENNPLIELKAIPEQTGFYPYYVLTGFHKVDEGYHSYNWFHHALFIIPKGTEYIDGWFNSFKGTPNRVSSNIVYIGCAWNPLTWLKAWSFKPSK